MRAPETPITAKVRAAVLRTRLEGNVPGHVVVKLNSRAHKALNRGRRVGQITIPVVGSAKERGQPVLVYWLPGVSFAQYRAL